MILANSRSKSSSDVIGTSFTEILLILLFVLLIFNYSNLAKINIYEQEKISLNNEISELKKIIKKRNEEISELKIQIRKLERELEILKSYAIQGKLNTDLIEEVVESNSRLTEENRRLLEELDRLGTKLKQAGISNEFPNCEINGKKIKQLAMIKAGINEYSISWNWNSSDEDWIKDNMPFLLNYDVTNKLSIQQFQDLGLKIYNWGLEQTPKCRFRAGYQPSDNLLNSTATQYKKMLSIAGRYFYAQGL